METKYTYNGEDITIDMMFKIEHIVSILAERESKDFDVVFAEFTASAIFNALQRTNNKFWAESSEFIADEYQKQRKRNDEKMHYT